MPTRFPTLLLAVWLAAPGAALAQGRSFDCVIDPAVTVQLGAPVSGLLDRVFVDQGDVVHRGQVVATLRSEVERTSVEVLTLQADSSAEIEAQQSRLALAEKRLTRIRSMAERNLTPRDELETAEAEREVTKRELAIAEMKRRVAALELDRARQQLAQREIASPIDGVVVERHLFDGEFLAQDGHVVTIAQMDPLKVEAYLPVDLFGTVAPGDVLRVRPEAPLTGSFEATIDVVDRVFDAASGTFGIRLHLDNPDQAIPAGHRCQVDLAPQGN